MSETNYVRLIKESLNEAKKTNGMESLIHPHVAQALENYVGQRIFNSHGVSGQSKFDKDRSEKLRLDLHKAIVKHHGYVSPNR